MKAYLMQSDGALRKDYMNNPSGSEIKIRDLPKLMTLNFALNLFISPSQTCKDFMLVGVLEDFEFQVTEFSINFRTVPVQVPFCSIHLNQIPYEEYLTEDQLDSLLLMQFQLNPDQPDPTVYSRLTFRVTGPINGTRLQRGHYNHFISTAGYSQTHSLSALFDINAQQVWDSFQIINYQEYNSIFRFLAEPEVKRGMQTLAISTRPDFNEFYNNSYYYGLTFQP